MTDRQPGAPGQYILTIDASEAQNLLTGQPVTVNLMRDDQPLVEGTPYNKASVLPDDLAAKICPDVTDPNIADALSALYNKKVSMDLLWENAKPDDGFAYDDIPVPGGYSHVMVDISHAVPALIVKKGSTHYAAFTGISAADGVTTIDLARRAVTFTDGTDGNDMVSFGEVQRSQYKTSTNKFNAMYTSTAILKPYRIFGIRGLV